MNFKARFAWKIFTTESVYLLLNEMNENSWAWIFYAVNWNVFKVNWFYTERNWMSQGYPTFHLQPTKGPSSLFIFRPCDEGLECQAVMLQSAFRSKLNLKDLHKHNGMAKSLHKSRTLPWNPKKNLKWKDLQQSFKSKKSSRNLWNPKESPKNLWKSQNRQRSYEILKKLAKSWKISEKISKTF